MDIDDKILINQFAQGIVLIDSVKERFSEMKTENKRSFMKNLLYYFILQSKVIEEDIDNAIKASNLKQTYTPCVMIKKGVSTSNLERLIALPENELEKVFVLLLYLFKIAYKRRYDLEKDSWKWWYWDLSDENKIKEIRSDPHN